MSLVHCTRLRQLLDHELEPASAFAPARRAGAA
jgi:hypothetical protein